MNKEAKGRLIVRSEQINNSLECMLNSLLISDFNYPIFRMQGATTEQIKQDDGKFESQDNISIINTLGSVQGVINTLKFMKKMHNKTKSRQLGSQKALYSISSYIFCRPIKNSMKDQKVFWIVKNKKKHKLNLDNPKGVLILPNDYLLAIQRKYLNLYQIQENLGISLKDFDSNGLGKKFGFTQVKNINYKQKQFLLIFGNQQIQSKTYFLVLVFQVTNGRLKFMKRALIAQKQVNSPTIIFQNDPSSKDQEKFCLVIGGCCENFQTYHYSGLKINLHLLLNQFLCYDISSTQVIPFSDKKSVIMSGKAIYFKDAWYSFCSQQQTINEVLLHFGGPGKTLTKIEIKSSRLNLKQKIYFNEDNLHYIFEGEQDKIVFLDKNLQLKQRSLNDLIHKIND